MSFTFLHAADLHLDTPFTNVGGYPEPVAHELRDASLYAWAELVRVAVARRVAFVLLAGDVYDGPERGIRAQLRFAEGLQELADNGIATYMVHGNHDPVEEGWAAVSQFPSSVHRFAAGSVESVEHRTADDQRVVVHGTSYATRRTTQNLSLGFPAARGPGFHIGLLHANVGGASGHADYSPCSIEHLRAPGYQYWALGHVHTRQVLHREQPWIVYPGNLQGRSPKPAERGPKGAVLVTVTDGRAAEPQFVALDRVRFVTVTASITDTDVAGLVASLQAQASPSQHDGRTLLVQGQVTGSGPLHAQLADPHRRADLLAELRSLGGSATGSTQVWWNQLTWDTRPAHDDVDLRGRGDFVSDLLATIDAATPTDRQRWVQALPGEVRRLLADDLPDPLDADLWHQAGRLAVESVSGADP